jgi:hypothetical protein
MIYLPSWAVIAFVTPLIILKARSRWIQDWYHANN